jgi:integrase
VSPRKTSARKREEAKARKEIAEIGNEEVAGKLLKARTGARRKQHGLAQAKAIRHELSITSKNVNGKIVEGDKTGEGKKRRVEVPGPVVEDLEEWRLASGGPGLIFYRAKDGLPWTKSDYDNWRARQPRKEKGTGIERRPPCFKRAAEDLGLGNSLRPYDLRHTFASLAASAGWTSDEIADQLGNGVDVVDRVYRHLIDTEPGARHNRRTIDDCIREARGLANLAKEAPQAGAA